MAGKNEMVITVRAIDAATRELNKVDTSVKKVKKTTEELAKTTAIAAATFGLLRRGYALITTESKEMERMTKDAMTFWGKFGDVIAVFVDNMAAATIGIRRNNPEMKANAEYTMQAAERLKTLVVRAERATMTEDQLTEEMERLNRVVAATDARLDAIGGTMTDSFLDGVEAMIDGTERLSDAFRTMVSNMLRQVARLLAQEAVFGLFRGLLGGLFGSNALGASIGAQGFTPNLPTSFGGYSIPPMHASGGPVMGGRPATVGEMGRETFVPSTSGYIQRGGGSGDTFNITVVESKDARATAQQVMAEIERNRGFRQRLQLA